MAKSLRSKWKRKMRQVKRERYGKKELERLKKTLGIEDTQGQGASNTVEVNMSELSEVINFTTAEEIKNKNQENQNERDVMDQSTVEDLKKFNSKTLMNDNGAYPIWVHPRKIRKCKKSNKDKRKSKKTNKGRIIKKIKKGIIEKTITKS
ncbi:protein LLP homolog [Diorhabda sublineata]|uniref:protein LLP homolog n=1 Tax=Diorhabda sublineata TaxID=1163346 RepID=UPI0024E0E438|nr:protein LLP homolog [Diorhabda sublineata]